MRGSREISLVPSLHRASTDALIYRAMQKCTSSIQSQSKKDLVTNSLVFEENSLQNGSLLHEMVASHSI